MKNDDSLKLDDTDRGKMTSSKPGIFVLIVGIALALIGAFLYQPALWGMLMETTNITYMHNAQTFAVISNGGLILTIVGAAMVFSNRNK